MRRAGAGQAKPIRPGAADRREGAGRDGNREAVHRRRPEAAPGAGPAGILIRIAVLAVILVLVAVRLAAVVPALLTPWPPLDPRTIHSGEFE